MDKSRSELPARHPALRVHQPVLKVVGLGGGGSNAVNRMIELGLTGVDFIAANTDRQSLQRSLAPLKIQLGPRSTRGLGAGGNPSVGQTAAEESWYELAQALQGADMVFLTAGMGGGTGTGSIPVAARLARAQNAVVVAIVSLPFGFERGRRQHNAAAGLELLRQHTDTLITIQNDRLLQIAPRNLSLDLAFRMADDLLRQAVQGITELITEPGTINVDFAHIRHIMKLGGGALLSIGQGQGAGKARQAVEQALRHPLLDNGTVGGLHPIGNAAGMLVNFTAGNDLTLFEVQEALEMLHQQAGPQVEIVLGVTRDDRLEERAQATLIVTGLGGTPLEEVLPGFRAATPAAVTPVIPAGACQSPALPLVAAYAGNPDLPAFLRRTE